MSDDNHTCDIYIRDTIHINTVIADIWGEEEDFSGCVPFEENFIDNSTNASSWNWTFGDGNFSTNENPFNKYNNDGKYNVNLIISDNYGCTDTINKEVTVFPLPTLGINNDTLICYGQSVQIEANGAEEYYWYPALYLDKTNSYNPTSTPEKSIKYNLMAVDSNKCVNYSSTYVKVQEIPKININDTSIVIGEIVNLDAFANDISEYLWWSESEISCTDCPNITVKPLESSVYQISITDINNCFTITKDININVMKKYSIDVPTAFTPNNDGINDFIFVKGWGIKELIEFKIYNRFGEMVFETQDKEIGWDGNYKGNPQNIETYIYTAKIKTYEDEILTKTGNIKLLR
ncbi:MAG: gliding motility-associated C-terminal domain-containing protein [Bacteroidales bacterium]|nr:gliding motility-associated C-terminal domain-containing protein [Bacteroidales bacterium]MBN2757033.1 gliding motility-associated C-terminal domain-containing protein [Bacteroidales bacterium]